MNINTYNKIFRTMLDMVLRLSHQALQASTCPTVHNEIKEYTFMIMKKISGGTVILPVFNMGSFINTTELYMVYVCTAQQ